MCRISFFFKNHDSAVKFMPIHLCATKDGFFIIPLKCHKISKIINADFENDFFRKSPHEQKISNQSENFSKRYRFSNSYKAFCMYSCQIVLRLVWENQLCKTVSLYIEMPSGKSLYKTTNK